MRGRGLVKGACFLLLSAGPVLVAIPSWGEEGATSVSDSAARPGYVATVLERKSGSLTLQRESGEIEILASDDPGRNLRVDPRVEKGSRVRVTEEKTGTSRTVSVELAPSS